MAPTSYYYVCVQIIPYSLHYWYMSENKDYDTIPDACLDMPVLADPVVDGVNINGL